METMKAKLESRIRSFRGNREGSIDAREWIVTIVLALVAILIGVSLLGTIQDTVDNSTATGATRSMLDLLPLIIAVGLLLLVVGAFIQKAINTRD
jgi:formate hydrogenlyase subunit 3/multisubunit Na+/H+ antiporter MnhD subunit